ncbi:tRNA-dihydrouridine synthase A [Legionella beliardensis]|uniref:tRNA-dihydrouridine synthase n=1 Tax=Legionella beliardensis TaxID=91822 RepID=A0A378I289_9GAMM|nr:tRNA dihydrouridine(20/20a) synthase DusA [Legionella beliardensis]STX28795.1 tRNA-dihydrouridine synthase A [Legionella beliardensis]
MVNALLSPLSVAPMIDWSYTHFRVLMRLIAPCALLYTDMQTVGAVKNNPHRSLSYSPMELPLALQLGGSDKEALVASAKLAAQYGYSEVNLNLGCPSDRVLSGRMGACLMAEANHVADCIKAMKQAVAIPVTAKTRIGIDNQDSYEFFASFAHKLIDAGCDKLIVHARKAWLHGLSPKQNRNIPPLHYDYVYRIKAELPQIPIIINGNILDLSAVKHHMNYVDGVMLGRLACKNPYALAVMHQWFFPNVAVQTRSQIMEAYLNYIEQQHKQGIRLSSLIKPIFNFAHGLPEAKFWKDRLLLAQQKQVVSYLQEAFRWLKENENATAMTSEIEYNIVLV